MVNESGTAIAGHSVTAVIATVPTDSMGRGLIGGARAPLLLAASLDHDIMATAERHLRGRAAVRACETIGSALRVLDETIDPVVVLHQVRPSDGDQAVPALQGLRKRFPRAPLMLVFRQHKGATQLEFAHDIAAATRAECVMSWCAEGSVIEIDRQLAMAEARSARGLILAALAFARSDVRGVAHDFITVASTSPRHVTSVAHVARILGVSVRTLERHLVAARLPRPRTLFWTIMVIRAASVLQDPRKSLKCVVRLLPFADDAAVGARFRRYGGCCPSRARGPETLSLLLERFKRVLSASDEHACIEYGGFNSADVRVAQ